CDLELLLRVEDDADGLLAVPQRRVIQADAAADPVLIVELARPDLAHARTTPSGNEESFSAPVAVIRKLSSTRRPPPPSQYIPGSIASTMPSSIVPPAAWWAYGGSWARAPTPCAIGCVGSSRPACVMPRRMIRSSSARLAPGRQWSSACP